MSTPAWDHSWIQSQAKELSMNAFRMVETQYVSATMRLVDTSDEQNVLESMLEQSKPPLPETAIGLHYLLAAPFRYLPETGSRFRAAKRPGVWYGADDVYCACAEIAYWRHRFILDSAGLVKGHINSEHSLYEAAVAGKAINLLAQPWSKAKALWQHPSDYGETQRLGEVVRSDGNVAWIRYGSVRATGHICAAVFDPRSLSMVTAERKWEQWYCHTTHEKVTMSNGRVRFDFKA